MQSVPAVHFLPLAQRVGQVLALPPQSTSVSEPSCFWSLQLIEPPQPSHPASEVPQVSPRAAQFCGVQPQAWAVPPPPQVSHVLMLLQSASLWQPQLPLLSHTAFVPEPQA
jgi:hypothetical protein